jgi:YidC/Oxa1 family membrane protein insertase
MEKQDQRNFLIAMALMVAFVFGYQKVFMEPAQKRFEAQQAAITADEQTGVSVSELSNVPAIAATKTVEEAISGPGRVKFDGESVDGSIRLAGSRIDDLSLRKHYLTVEKKQEIRLFRPEASEYGYFATYYWADGTSLVAGRNSPWVQVGLGHRPNGFG